MTPLKAEYITADQLPLIIFRLQLRGGPYIPITPFHRWDEKAGLQRDAIRSQRSTCSRHKEKETGYEKD
jgi:hypothetical protein